MNDRYLYKAKQKNWKELPKDEWWVIGNLIIERNLNDEIKYRICPLDYAQAFASEIDPSTICQCTGLTDKNGKKIWENDIVYIRGNGLSGKGVIAYENGCFVLKDKKRQRTYSLFGNWKFRVDGNIFDNPELLEGGHETGKHGD